MKLGVSIGSVLILALLGGSVWYFLDSDRTTEQTATEQEGDNRSDEATRATDAAVTITYSDTGFSASSNTVSAGSKVMVVNNSNSRLEFSSDPHPQHTDNSEYNLPTLRPGEEASFVVEELGRWGYHNHLNDDHSGFITVTD